MPKPLRAEIFARLKPFGARKNKAPIDCVYRLDIFFDFLVVTIPKSLFKSFGLSVGVIVTVGVIVGVIVGVLVIVGDKVGVIVGVLVIVCDMVLVLVSDGVRVSVAGFIAVIVAGANN